MTHEEFRSATEKMQQTAKALADFRNQYVERYLEAERTILAAKAHDAEGIKHLGSLKADADRAFDNWRRLL